MIVVIKLCLNCGKEHTKRQQYCSDICRWDAKNKKVSLETKDKIVEKECVCCKQLFIPKALHPRYKYCSLQCKDKFNKEKAKVEGRNKLWKRDKEKNRITQRRSYQENKSGRKEYILLQNEKRRALTSRYNLDPEFSSFVFQEAQLLRKLRDITTNVTWHVDHIVPLKGRLVCGLHIWNNFAVIPKQLNLEKSNAFYEES